MPRLYLHIGYPKTGTTSLQKFFADNAVRLRERGLLYPLTGRLNNAHYNINFSLNIGAHDAPQLPLDAAALREALRLEFLESGCESLLLSSEYFITAQSLADIKEFFSDYDMTIIVYLRRHDRAFESGYSQAVRSSASPPWGPTIESFVLYQLGLGTFSYDYLAVLRRWAAAFGIQRVLVRPYERAQNKPDLYADFLKLVGVDAHEDFQRPPAEANPALSSTIVAAIDAVQRSAIEPDFKASIVGKLIQSDGTPGRPDEPFRLPPALRLALVAKYRQSYGVIAKDFMGRENRKLFEEPPPRRDEPWTPPAPQSGQEMVDLVLRAAAAARRTCDRRS